MMVESMKVNTSKVNIMVKGASFHLMETSMKGNSRMGKDMVKEPTLGLMVESMKVNTSKVNIMVKGSSFHLMETVSYTHLTLPTILLV